MNHPRYGTGASGVRIERSQPAEEDRHPPQPMEYYHNPPRQKLTIAQKERDREIRTQEQARIRERLRGMLDDFKLKGI